MQKVAFTATMRDSKGKHLLKAGNDPVLRQKQARFSRATGHLCPKACPIQCTLFHPAPQAMRRFFVLPVAFLSIAMLSIFALPRFAAFPVLAFSAVLVILLFTFFLPPSLALPPLSYPPSFRLFIFAVFLPGSLPTCRCVTADDTELYIITICRSGNSVIKTIVPMFSLCYNMCIC